MTPTAELQRRVLALAGAFVALMLSGAAPARADSVVVFNEIQYHPWDPAGAEWIEFHNQMALDVDLSGWRLTGGANFDFPSGTVIPAGGYLIVSGDPAAVGFGSLGPWVGSLSNAGERLRLRNNSGRLMDEVDYGDRGVWRSGRMDQVRPWQRLMRTRQVVSRRVGEQVWKSVGLLRRPTFPTDQVWGQRL